MPPRPQLALLAFFAIALGVPEPSTLAQDARKDVTRQKEVAAANLKKADLGKTAVVESAHFLIATPLPETKAKALGGVLDKVVPTARKALQFEEKEEAWKGKLTIYFLPDARDFKGFIRSVVAMQPGGIHYELRADEPFIVDPVDVPATASEAEQFVNAAAAVAGAYLKVKGGSAVLPPWLINGFGRVTALRAEGLNSRRYLAHKTMARGVASRGGKPTELWGDVKPASADVLASSFVEYLAYGPGAANFAKLISGFRPDEGGNTPGAPAAFEAAGWKDLAMLEAAWKKWAMTGK
jgi:hypothetical protein